MLRALLYFAQDENFRITNEPNQGAPGETPVSGGDLNLPGFSTNPEQQVQQIQTLLGILFALLGAVALIYIIYGGLQYIYSSGEPQKAAQAKQTIIYAIIGLVIAVSAETIVWTVIDKL